MDNSHCLFDLIAIRGFLVVIYRCSDSVHSNANVCSRKCAPYMELVPEDDCKIVETVSFVTSSYEQVV